MQRERVGTGRERESVSANKEPEGPSESKLDASIIRIVEKKKRKEGRKEESELRKRRRIIKFRGETRRGGEGEGDKFMRPPPRCATLINDIHWRFRADNSAIHQPDLTIRSVLAPGEID